MKQADIEHKTKENTDGTFQELCKPDKKAGGFSRENDDQRDAGKYGLATASETIYFWPGLKIVSQRLQGF